jgi:hypothetical protein
MTMTLADLSGFLSGALGTTFYSILLFAAGAWVGPPFWSWVKGFLPWTKK